MQCLNPSDLMEFIFMVANWFYYNADLQMMTFQTDYGVFQWASNGDGLLCFVGELT